MTKTPNKSAKKQYASSTSKLGLMALEPRILLDAAAVTTGAEVAMEALHQAHVREAVEALTIDSEALQESGYSQPANAAYFSDADIKAISPVILGDEKTGGHDYVNTDIAPPNGKDVSDTHIYGFGGDSLIIGGEQSNNPVQVNLPVFEDTLDQETNDVVSTLEQALKLTDISDVITGGDQSDAPVQIDVSGLTQENPGHDSAAENVFTGDFDPEAIVPTDTGVTVVFVDSAVEGYEDLIAGLSDDVEVIIIGEGEDGLEVMAETLSGRDDIEAIHILSHGDAGQLQLGTATLTRESIEGEYADELALIGEALSDTADILIYGCDFGADIEAVNALAQATGADIAASDNDTGAARLGGDWNLEIKSGDIEAVSFAITAFEGLLDTSVINSTGGQASDGSDGLVIHVAANGQLQVEFRGETQFFHPDTTDDDDALFNGVYLAVGNDVVAPGTDSGLNTPIPFQEANQAAGDIGDSLFVEAGQMVSGSGTANDPTIVTTTLFYDAAGDGGAYDPTVDFEVVIETIYVTPNPYFTQRVTITPPSGNTDPIKFYHAIDTFLNINVPPGSNPDAGPAFTLEQAPGNPSVVGVARDVGNDGTIDAFVAFAEDQGGEEFDQFYSARFNGPGLYANGIANGGDIINTLDTNPNTDNGLGIQFNLDNPGQAQTFTYHIAFRGEATIDLDADDSAGVTGSGYQGFYVPGSGATIPIADSDAAIQNVVGDIQEVRVSLLNAETGDMLTVDSANLPLTVRVQSQSATEIILEAIDFPRAESVFDQAIAELGFTTTSTVTGERTIEFTVTNEIGETGTAAAGAIIVNTDPVAANDGPVLIQADSTVTIPVLTNTANTSADTDVDGDPLTITAIIDPANPGTPLMITQGSTVTLASGTQVSLLAGGELSVTTQASFSANETFSYVVDDGNQGTDSATVALLFDNGAVNEAPVLDLDLTPAGVPGEGGFTVLTFSNPTITNDGQNEATHGVGNGETARYSNVGTVLGQSIDLVATVLTATTNASGAPFDNPTLNVSSGDNANVGLGGNNNNSAAGNDGNATVDIRWQVVLSGTDTPITGNFAVLVNDLDQSNNNMNRFEEISLDVTQLDSYVLEGDTDIDVTQSGNIITFNPSDSDPGTPGVTPGNTVQLNFSGTSEFVITYNRQSAGGNFGLDGNFTAGFFSNPVLVDVNADFATTTFENAGAVRITDTDLTVTDDGLIASATITLTNPQVGDWLLPPSITAEPEQSGNIVTESGNTDFTVVSFMIDGDTTLHTAGASVTLPDIGALSIDGDGSYSFTPLLTYTGSVPDVTVTLENTVVNPGDDLDDPADDITVTLTRTETLSFDPLVALLPAGISLDPASSATNIILTGLATPEAYAVALNIVQFNSISEDPDQTDRLVNISVTDDGGLTSNIGQTTIIVIPQNDAPMPVLDTDSSDGTVAVFGDGSEVVPSVVTLLADRENPGTILVSDLLAQLNVNDIEDTDFGIGVVFASEANGVWQYRRTDIPGHEWTDFQLGDPDNTDPTPVPDGEALLFDPDTEIRFIANEGFSGAANIQFRVWDMTVGTASNPPSTILDDSATQTDTSSLSSTVFVAGTATDYDGDGEADTTDLDDDNDGIADLDEAIDLIVNGDFSQDPTSSGWTVSNFVFYDSSADFIEFRANDLMTTLSQSGLQGFDAGLGAHGAAQVEIGLRVLMGNPIATSLASQIEIVVGGTVYAVVDSGNQNTAGEMADITYFNGASGNLSQVPIDGRSGPFIPFSDWIIDLPANVAATGDFQIRFDGGTDDIALEYVRILTTPDTDSDGVFDYLDLDSDNDGISDLIESGQDHTVVDTNNDGVHDGGVNASGVPTAANGGNGATPINTDGDGVADILDLDSDNDGIPDQVEAQPTAGYQTLTHANNASNFGVNDIGLFVPSNSDGDSLFDFRDTNSDNDSLLDSAESGLTPGADNNGDGIGDNIGASYADGDGNINDPQNDLANQSGDTSQVGYREGNSTPDVDLNDDGTTADTSFATTFTEGGGAVNVADTDASVLDFGDNDIVSLTIVGAGITDGASEIVTIGGQDFALNANASATVTAGGSNFDVNYVAGTNTFTIVDSVNPANTLSVADLTTLLRGITYENTSTTPTETDRTLTFTAEDSLGDSGLSGVSTITVVAENDIDGDGESDEKDLDDDNDGIADRDEAIDLLVNGDFSQNPLSAGWTVSGPTFYNSSADTVSLSANPATTTLTQSGLQGFDTGFGPNGTAQVEIGIRTLTADPRVGSNSSQLEIIIGGTVYAIIDTGNDNTAGETADVTYFNGAAGNLTEILIDDRNGPDPDTPVSDWIIDLPADVVASGDFQIRYTGDGDDFTLSYVSILTTPDTDSDGVFDYLDLDSDNDGISDLIESGQNSTVVDTNNDGVHDGAVNGSGVPTAANGGNGVTPVNTDGDAVADFRDLDSDNDGIPDAVEARNTAGYTSSTHVNNATNDGVNDDGLYVPVNTDGDANFDFRDTNSDGDTALDSAESGLTPGADNNGDGIGDGINASYADPDGDANDPQNDLTNLIGDPNEADYREGNMAPTAVDDGPVDVTEDTPVSGNVLTNDSDVDGDTLSVGGFTVAGDATNYNPGDTATIAGVGTITLASNGSYTFTPEPDYVGPVPDVTVTVEDGNGGSTDSTLSFNDVVNVNDAPVIVDDGPVDVTEDTPVSGNILTNDSDVDGDTLSVTGFMIAGDPTNYNPGDTATIAGVGTITLASDGSYTFTPEPDYVGPVPSVTATVTDGNGESDTSTLSFNDVTNVNDAPSAVDDGPVDVTEDTPVSGNVLTNDSDTEGDTLSVGGFSVNGMSFNPGDTATIAGVGTITIASDGGYTFTPEADYFGPVPDVTVTVEDGNGGSADSTLSFNDIVNVNDAPVIVDDGPVAVTEDMPVSGNILTNDSDADGDTLSVTGFTVDGDPTNYNPGDTATIPGVGAITLASDGGYTFTPEPDYTGPVPDVTATVDDGNGESGMSTLSFMDVANVNDAPAVVDDGPVDVTEDTPVSGNVLTNDSDADGDPLSVGGFMVAGDPTSYNPGDTATIAGVGTITIASDGGYTFTPEPDYFGPIPDVMVSVEDGNGGSTDSTLSFNDIANVNDAPAAVDDGPVAVTEDTPVSGNVLTNDSDADGDTLSVGGFNVNGMSYNPGDTATIAGVGTVTIASDGSYTFTPEPDYVGPVPDVTVTVEDGNGGSTDSTLSFMDVVNVNDAPAVVDDGPVDVTEDTPVSGNVLTNDSDADGDTLSVGGFMVAGDPTSYNPGDTATIPGVGTITIASDGGYTFTPAPDYVGPVPDVAVTVEDGNGGSTDSTLSFNDTVNVNDAPAVVDDGPVTLTEDMPASGNILTNDSDADGDTLSVTGFTVDGDPTSYNPGDTATIPGVGTITIASDGGYTFTPEPDYVGPVPDVTATVEDGNGGSTDGVLSFMDVANVNDAPVANDDMETTGENTVASESVLTENGNGADTDVDGDTLTVTHVNGTAIVSGDPITLPSGAILTINSDGTYLYNPNNQFEDLQQLEQGTDSFTYTIDDGNGGTNTATVTFTLTGVNDAPVAADNDEAFDAGLVSSGNVITDNDATHGQDSDVEGDTLVISQVNGMPLMDGVAVTLPSGALLTVNADGSYSFDPNGQYQSLAVGEMATDGFSYTIDDGFGGTDTANVVITVNGVNDAPEPLDPSNPAGPADDQNYIPLQTADDSAAVTALDLTAFFTDPDTSDTLTLTLDPADLPSGLMFDGTQITGTVAADASQGGAAGTYVIPVTADDGNGGTFTTNVTYTITNPAPVIDTPIGAQAALDADTVSYATAASDPDGDTLTYSASGLPTGLSIDTATGVISGTIDSAASQGGPNSDGVYNVTVTVDDGQGGVVTDMFDLTLTNPAPIAQDDAVGADEDGPDISGSVLVDNGAGADMDPDGDMITVAQVNGDPASVGQSVAGTDGGLFTVNADGSYTFMPNADFEHLDMGETQTTSVTYQLSDGQGGFDTATVTVTVSGANDAPHHVDPSDPTGPVDPQNYIPAQSGQDSTALTDLDLTPFFADVDDEPLTYGLDNPPVWLSVDPVSGILSGTPPADASQLGPNNDGVYAVTVTVTDPDGEMISTVVEYTITNPPPIAQDDSVPAPEDGPAIMGSVFDNNGSGADIDPDGDAITVVSVNGNAANVGASIVGPVGGVFTVNADGTYSFDPAGNFEYLDEGEVLTTSITYEISDGQGGSDDATLSVMIIGANDAPVVLDPNLSLPTQTVADGMTIDPLDLGGAFGDDDETPLTFSASSLPPGLSIDPVTGVVSGTLTSGASQGGDGGVYTAIITATDPEGVSASTSIEYTVTNLAPTSQDDSFTITEETSLSANILVNDTDVDGDILVIDAVALADGAVIAVGETVTVPEGMLTVAANGDINFVPAPDYFGTFVFGYTVTDNNGDTDMGSVTIIVENVNDAPAIVDDGPVAVTEDTPVSGNVLSNDSDADGDLLTVGGFTVDGDPTAYGPGDTATIEGVGTITIAGDGTYTFTPEPDYTGPVPDVTVTVTDPSGAVASSTLSFSDIENVNDAPVLTGISLDVPTLIEGETIAPISVSEAFMDADDDPLIFSADGLPPGLSIDPETGIITGTLPGDAGVNSPYEVTIIAMDPSGAIQTLSVVITLENPAPIVDQPDRTGSGVDGSDGEILALDGGTHQAGLETEIDVAVFIEDPDNDALTYRAEGLPDGLSVDPETGVISGTPLVPTERPVAALLTVTDAQGGVLQFTLNLVVEGEVSTRPNYNETFLSERIVTESDPYAWVDTQPVNLRLWFAEHSLAVKGLEGLDLSHIGTDVEFRRGMAVSRASCYSDACSYLIVETLAYEHHINMQLGSTIALENDIDVRSWEVTQSDGSALPDWATHEAGADMVFIQRPLDQTLLDLQIRAIFEDGRMVTIEATVDLMTGDLRLSEETQNRVQTLSEQLKLATQSLQNQDADLIRALAG